MAVAAPLRSSQKQRCKTASEAAPAPSPLGAQSTFILLHQRGGGVKVLLRDFLTEKVTKR